MQTKVYLVILGMLIANYLPRAFPMVVLSKLNIPRPVILWLAYIPPAVLGAIIAPSLFMPHQEMMVTFNNNHLLAAIPTFAVAIITRSLVWTLMAGMLAMALFSN